ncbi:aminoglycoside phosphotransferase family protein [Pseudofrankia sp. DC12]|uniref:aminoglycoside phosphotransferase family protein n=1 Tax=Pseudofrankia sp. DC12 TaxID=683315 RepID=UPI001E39388B|nr:aminoglycoside phosphotransferase family protein [Pseudofrankia sp. DC12]
MTGSRTVSAVISCDGESLGLVGPFAVQGSWAHDVPPVVARLRAELGVPVAVLRAVEIRGEPRGGQVIYHVEAFERPRRGRLGPVPGDLEARIGPDPLRAAWATRAGLLDALDWAARVLRAVDRAPVGPAEQIKTWNLSGLFRFPTARGPVWLKTLPTFAADEAAALAAVGQVAPALVPAVVAADPAGRRLLLDHVPGTDCWDPSPDDVRAAVGGLARAQAALADEPALIPSGVVHDRRLDTLAVEVAGLVAGEAGARLEPAERAAAQALVARLPDLAAALDACGLPETLVHGDFHSGNWRSGRTRGVILDFSESGRGHPTEDGVWPRECLPDDLWTLAADTWVAAWRESRPGSDPARALALAAPLGHLGHAVSYQGFLDGIEPSEYPYHFGDTTAALRDALQASAEAAV